MLKRNRAMELYRFVAAVLILCYHCYWVGFRMVDTVDETVTQFQGFYLLVELFFILSGFLMLASIRRHTTEEDRLNPASATWRYVGGRLRQFYPQHLLSWILVAILALFFIKNVFPIEVVQYGWTELLLVNIFGFVRGGYINIVCWYLSATIFCSLIIYFLLLKDEDTFIKIIAPILLVLCLGTLFDRKGSLANTIIFTQYSVPLGFMRALSDMTIGCVAYRVYEWMQDVELPGERIWATILELAVMAASGLWMFQNSGKWDFAFLILFFAFVISVFRGKSLLTCLFDNKFSGWLGQISFPYFLNNLVAVYLCMYLFPEAGIWQMCLFCIPVCFVISLLTDGFLRLILPRYRRQRVGRRENLSDPSD